MAKRVNWTRDEYILALELYLKYPKSAPSKTNPILSEYSKLMRSMHPNEASLDPELRNENGVYLRLMNFRSVDPYWMNQGKVGMTSGKVGKCKEIWDEFESNPELVFELAGQIKSELISGEWTHTQSNTESLSVSVATEGKLVLNRHFRRERSPKLRSTKLKQQTQEFGKNFCEACMQDAERYNCPPEKILEVHHKLPLHKAEAEVETRLSDLAILCANFHKSIHAVGSPEDIQSVFKK